MKYIKRTIYIILALPILMALLAYATGHGYLIKGVRQTYLRGYKTAEPDDHRFFSNRRIAMGAVQVWPESQRYNTYTLPDDFRKYLEKYQTIAYLIIEDGQLAYERYWDGYGKKHLSNSFSMAKTMVTLMLAHAIQAGLIKGLDQLVGDFFPEYSKGLASELTLGDLSSMRTGLNWDENYVGLFSIAARSYYGKDLPALILGLKVTDKPGQRFDYVSGATQLLGMVLQKASGQNLSDYLSAHFWRPLGMNADGLWSLDEKDGMEKAFCCVHSNARNFAKFGQLLLQQGYWQGQQLVDSGFVAKMTHPAAANSPQYGYGLWTDYRHDPPLYAMIGHDGQYVIAVPKYHMVVVRLGFYRDRTKEAGALLKSEVYRYVDGALRTLQLKP